MLPRKVHEHFCFTQFRAGSFLGHQTLHFSAEPRTCFILPTGAWHHLRFSVSFRFVWLLYALQVVAECLTNPTQWVLSAGTLVTRSESQSMQALTPPPPPDPTQAVVSTLRLSVKHDATGMGETPRASGACEQRDTLSHSHLPTTVLKPRTSAYTRTYQPAHLISFRGQKFEVYPGLCGPSVSNGTRVSKPIYVSRCESYQIYVQSMEQEVSSSSPQRPHISWHPGLAFVLQPSACGELSPGNRCPGFGGVRTINGSSRSQ